MPRRRQPTHDDLVITRAEDGGSYLLEGGDLPVQTFAPKEWTQVRIAAIARLKPGSTVWFSDAAFGGSLRELDIETGVLLDE